MSMNGIDISSWQTGIDLSAVPCDFVIVKATGGIGYINPDCDRAYRQAKRFGKKLGVYHFAREAGCEGSAQQEAEFFLKNIEAYIGEAVLVLDWEGDAVSLGVGWAKEWLDTVYARTGVRPMLYSYNNCVNTCDWSEVARLYALWNAGYYNYGTQMGYNPDAPLIGGTGAWSDAAMYQYTSEGKLSGWGGNLDLNVFYGDGKAWEKYAAGDRKKPIPPETTPPPKSAKVRMERQTGADNQRWFVEDTGNGYIYLRNKKTGLYLDIPQGKAVNDAVLQVYEGNKRDSQTFKLVKKSHGYSNYALLEPKLAPGRYVSVENNGLDGKDKLKLWDDMKNSKQKFWTKQADDGSYVFVHTYSLMAIAVQ